MAVGEWDQRELCPDGGCVGVIGSDGHCKVCLRAAINWGNERDRGLNVDAPAAEALADDEDDDLEDDDDEYEDDDAEDGVDDVDDDDDDDEDSDDAAALAALDPSTPSLIGGAAEWNDRQLCIDGGCVGLIGEDGTCKVCGKVAPGTAKTKHTSTSPVSTLGSSLTPARTEDAELLAAATDMAASLPDEAAVDRKLCPDGACVGVIGDDGHCKLCGKVAA